MPLAVRRLPLPGADDVGDDLAAGRALDAEVPVLEVAAQTARHEFDPGAVADVEALGTGVHWHPPSIGVAGLSRNAPGVLTSRDGWGTTRGPKGGTTP